MTKFEDLGLGDALLAALATEGYTQPTPIQAQAIPHILEGRDLLGIAQTGTGKTAAFALPILHRLALKRVPLQPRAARVLVLAPTRELASQIADSFTAYGRGQRLSVAVVYGGVDIRKQFRATARGVDVLVATPGRLVDHLQQGTIRLDTVETVVLDEVDRMLDIGFIHAVRRILKLVPASRQTLFFSATMPKEAAVLAGELLREPARVTITPVATTAERVEQQVIHVADADKRTLLAALLGEPSVGRTLVFTRTKHRADRVAKHLDAAGIDSAAIHGNKSQNQRERALGGFKAGTVRVLVATDIAARGIDVDGITHVVNFDLPDVPESYVHRIGRTARAGQAGRAIAFCDPAERGNLRDIERTIRQQIPVLTHPAARAVAPVPSPQRQAEPRRQPQPAEPRRQAQPAGRAPGGQQPARAPGGQPPARQHRGRPSRAPSRAPQRAGAGY
ncbi:MAG: DEAD/DEAH box helicase [Geminicoccaceae bacterium]